MWHPVGWRRRFRVPAIQTPSSTTPAEAAPRDSAIAAFPRRVPRRSSSTAAAQPGSPPTPRARPTPPALCWRSPTCWTHPAQGVPQNLRLRPKAGVVPMQHGRAAVTQQLGNLGVGNAVGEGVGGEAVAVPPVPVSRPGRGPPTRPPPRPPRTRNPELALSLQAVAAGGGDG